MGSTFKFPGLGLGSISYSGSKYRFSRSFSSALILSMKANTKIAMQKSTKYGMLNTSIIVLSLHLYSPPIYYNIIYRYIYYSMGGKHYSLNNLV